MVEIFDLNMDTAIERANEIGPPRPLPKSFKDIDQRARLVDHIDSKLIQNSLLHELDDKENAKRLNDITDLSRQFISDINDDDDGIKNWILRLWAGCMSAAKEIALETNSGPNTPERRNIIFSKKSILSPKVIQFTELVLKQQLLLRDLGISRIPLKVFWKHLLLKSIHDSQEFVLLKGSSISLSILKGN